MAGKIIAALVLLLVIASLTGAVYYYKNEATEARADAAREKAEKEIVIAANKEQQKAMDDLVEANRKNSVVTAAVFTKLEEISKDTAENSAAVVELKETNDDVKAYLSNLVPGDLQLQLNK